MATEVNDHIRIALRQLPQINDLLESDEVRVLLLDCPRNVLRELIRAELAETRSRILQGQWEPALDRSRIVANVSHALRARHSKRIQRVINATGIVIHTNLGRVPMAEAAAQAAAQAARNYTNLEMDLGTGKRGHRGGTINALLSSITGAESAMVVNNNAAAIFLALSTIAKDGEVVVSRGEMVEIGGGFRIPDVVLQCGARLVEVGSTNKTRVEDYSKAICNSTKVLLKVHPSNFKISGFTEETTVRQLSELAQGNDIVVMNDLGSGSLVDLSDFGLPHETTVSEMIRAGADIVTVSGDKLLGGPQCGIILGRKELVSSMASNSLFRALRADKMTLAALEATLELYMDRSTISEELPALQMLLQTPSRLSVRLNRILLRLSSLPKVELDVCQANTYAGGGALPMEPQETVVLRIRTNSLTPDDISKRLRENTPPIIAMIKDGYVAIDLRTVHPGDDLIVESALVTLLRTEEDS